MNTYIPREQMDMVAETRDQDMLAPVRHTYYGPVASRLKSSPQESTYADEFEVILKSLSLSHRFQVDRNKVVQVDLTAGAAFVSCKSYHPTQDAVVRPCGL